MPVCVRLQQGRDEPSRCRRLRTVSWFPFLGCQPYFCTWERFSVAKTLETFYVDLFIKTTHCSLARPSRQRSLTARAALRRRGSALGDIRLRRHGDSGRPGAAAFGPRSLAAVHRAARNLRPHGRPRGPARRDPSLRFSTLLRFCRERRRTSEDRRPTSSSTQPLDRPGHEHDASVPKAQDFRVPRRHRRFALPAILPGSASGNDARSRRRPSRTGVRNRSGIFPRRKPVNPAKKSPIIAWRACCAKILSARPLPAAAGKAAWESQARAPRQGPRLRTASHEPARRCHCGPARQPLERALRTFGAGRRAQGKRRDFRRFVRIFRRHGGDDASAMRFPSGRRAPSAGTRFGMRKHVGPAPDKWTGFASARASSTRRAVGGSSANQLRHRLHDGDRRRPALRFGVDRG